MKLHALPRQSRRALALGLLALAAAIAAGLIWMLLSTFVFDLDAKAKAVETRVTSVNSVAASVSQLRAGWARLERDPRLSVDMFPPASDAQASAAVQSATQKLFARSGATIRSIQTLDVERDGAVRKVGVRVAVTGTSNQINRALQAVSASRPVLMVSTGNISLMPDSRRPTNEPSAPQLQATFNIFAYARNG